MRYSPLRRILAWCIALCFAMASGLAVPASAEEPLELFSEAAVLMDASTGQVLYAKNGDMQLYPASITKVMTALLALSCLNPQDVLTVSQTAVDAVPRTSSHISLDPGEQITVEQAMYALAMESANDAANVLAEAVSGSLSAFAQRMTAEAVSLGTMRTNFTNANGLPDDAHYTTAYDMALITAAAMKVPGFLEYFSRVHYECPPTNRKGARVFDNKSQILSGDYFYEGVLMSKTGWTSSAQGTFVTAAQRGDTTLIVVALKSPRMEQKYQDANALFDYGFSRFSLVDITGEALAQQIDLGDYFPMEGQKTTYLLPVGTTFSQMQFTLAKGMDLASAGEERTAVTIQASVGDMRLPDTNLILERKPAPEEPEETEAAEPEETVSAAAAAVRIGAKVQKLLTVAVCVIVVIFLAAVLYERYRARCYRRYVLKGRIHRMKKKIGTQPELEAAQEPAPEEPAEPVFPVSAEAVEEAAEAEEEEVTALEEEPSEADPEPSEP